MNRARTIVRQLIGDGIRVVVGDRLVKFVTRAGQVEAAFARLAGGNDRQTDVVAGARYALFQAFPALPA